jgi:hypothetical protein
LITTLPVITFVAMGVKALRFNLFWPYLSSERWSNARDVYLMDSDYYVALTSKEGSLIVDMSWRYSFPSMHEDQIPFVACVGFAQIKSYNHLLFYCAHFLGEEI